MRYVFTAMLMVICGCAMQTGPTEPDLLDQIAKQPPKASRQDENGQFVHAKYQHFEVDEAVAALSDVPRPWSVERMLHLYTQERDPKRKAHILWVLAASRDPRAGLILGQDLTASDLVVRVAATYGLMDFFMDGPVTGGTEQHMSAAQKWWKANRQQLESTAIELGKKDTEQSPAVL